MSNVNILILNEQQNTRSTNITVKCGTHVLDRNSESKKWITKQWLKNNKILVNRNEYTEQNQDRTDQKSIYRGEKEQQVKGKACILIDLSNYDAQRIGVCKRVVSVTNH